LCEVDRKPHDHDSKHLAACIAHERARAAPWHRCIKSQESDKCAYQDDKKLQRVCIADHPREEREVSEDHQHQAARQAIEAIEGIDCIDDGDGGKHGQRDRPVHQLYRTTAEEISQGMQKMIAPRRH